MILGFDMSYLAHRDFRPEKHLVDGLAQQMISKIVGCAARFKNPTVFLAYDHPAPTFRHQIYPAYKQGRKKRPGIEAIKRAIEQTKGFATDARFHVVEHEGYEADDILAAVARYGREKRVQTRIFSGDKDLYPLTRLDGVELFTTITSAGWNSIAREVALVGEVTPSMIKRKYGIDVLQWEDFRCLIGDTSDNIPGAVGCGPAKAKVLLNAYVTLQAIQDDWEYAKENMAAKYRKGLTEDYWNKELPIYRRLFTLHDDLRIIG